MVTPVEELRELVGRIAELLGGTLTDAEVLVNQGTSSKMKGEGMRIRYHVGFELKIPGPPKELS